MIVYPDTSLLVPLFMEEPGTPRAEAWLNNHSAGQIGSSAWTNIEFMSAIGMRCRRGDLSPDAHKAAIFKWRQLENSFESVPIPAIAFHDASLWLAQSALGLRSGDALHLAIAKAAGATVWTLDNVMFRAGQTLGLSVAQP